MRDEIMRLVDQMAESASVAQANAGSVSWRTLRRYETELRALARTDHVEDKLGMMPEGYHVERAVGGILHKAGWRGEHDDNWLNLRSVLPEIAATIAAAPAPDHSAGVGVSIDVLAQTFDDARVAEWERLVAAHGVRPGFNRAATHKASTMAGVSAVIAAIERHLDHSAGVGGIVSRTGTVADISDEDLLRRAMSNLFRKRLREPAWARVSDVFGLGSTYSAQLCRRFERDPETGKSTALAQPADADAEGGK